MNYDEIESVFIPKVDSVKSVRGTSCRGGTNRASDIGTFSSLFTVAWTL